MISHCLRYLVCLVKVILLFFIKINRTPYELDDIDIILFKLSTRSK